MTDIKLKDCDKTCKLKEAIGELATFAHSKTEDDTLVKRGDVYKVIFAFLMKNKLIKVA